MNDHPSLSVVIIGRNEGARLERCLQSVAALHPFGGEKEVIYVDSASTDSSVETAAAYRAKVIRIAPRHLCAAAARNAGFRAASGEIILFLDGDTILTPEFVTNSLLHFQDPRVAVVCGNRREVDPGGSIFNRVLDLDWIYPSGPTLFCGGDALIRRSVLEAVKGFDENLIAGEEPEMCWRIRALGYTVLHLDSAMVGHDLAMTRFSQYWRRALRSGYALAEISARFQQTQSPLWLSESRRNLVHGVAMVILMLTGLLASAVLRSLLPAMIVVGILLILTLRSAYRARWKNADVVTLLLYGLHSQLQHVPILLGQIKCRINRITGRTSALIEYKYMPSEVPANLPQSPARPATNGSGTDDLSDLSILLISPNVAESMGGEAIKALQIYRALARRNAVVQQITHERVKEELQANFTELKVSYIRDTRLQKALYRAGLLNPMAGIAANAMIALIFQFRAAQLARKLLKNDRTTIVHFTSPVSPVLPYFRVPGAAVIIGPLNGNIHYPTSFRNRESFTYRVQRILHPVLQRIARVFPAKREAEAILVAGGERTRRSLVLCGCREEQLITSIDSGVLDELCQAPRVKHAGTNYRFVHNGRLVAHKGADLAIRSLALTREPIELDIIGRGPELNTLKSLARQLRLEKRVTFVEWVTDHSKLADALRTYRGFVFPSLAEANGIVVQEAMVMGLPVIALNWGGPALLVTPESGVLVDPVSEEYVVHELAKAMDRLATNGELADQMSSAGRQRALKEGYQWSRVIDHWASLHRQIERRRRTAVHDTNKRQKITCESCAHLDYSNSIALADREQVQTKASVEE